MNILFLSVLLFAVLMFLFAGTMISCRKIDSAWAMFLEKLPREKKSGSMLCAVAVFWCIPNIRPILSPDSFLQDLLIPLAVAAVVLCILYLDYLFARSVSALFILTVHALLKELFPGVPGLMYSFFAAFLMILSIIGMCIAAKPYWMRDAFRLAFRSKIFRFSTALYFLLTGLLALCNLPCIH